jgi:RimJ/RimL family protein N-acetyltransferase
MSKINIRKAAHEDVHDLFKWRNDELTRKMSRNDKKINFQDHHKWFKDTLANKSKVVYIAEIDSFSIGVVRFDEIKESLYEVNIDINPKSRGKNYGMKVTALGILELEKDKNAKAIFSTVKKVNVPSLKLFERLGFRETESDKIYNYYLLNIKEDLNREYI